MTVDGTHAVVLGGAGFLGSHLADRLVADGARVTVVDDLSSGSRDNVPAGVAVVEADISHPFEVEGDVDWVLNLASLASPPHYLAHPLHTLRTGSRGTEHGLQLAQAYGARFLQASTSEVYGDPQVHPQPESYWGHVNPVGPRAVYDEAKRYGEALTTAYVTDQELDAIIVRIFNTYGPRMRVDDGRAVPAFFEAALQNRPLPVHGDGSQTRSLCYVDDLISGLTAALTSSETGPINLGNPHEVTILELATAIQDVVGNHPGVDFHPRPIDDPTVRQPDISLARELLGWEPEVSLSDGLARTLDWFAGQVTA